ncbi:iron complex outermembrane recepter protein [Desulfosarcina sp. BuS5]|uniref:TonB-dependent receptor n=1 Tax=Desulfosarcina sp. BuS5 TaxID=933262 RepID=UPI0004858559|nr:TonB-dependent receptor [Desulfosarcina sp. BuS5]WDN88739.1 iron complex outermembrane recepter protein [Desulfosarcina sp. BuS5]
MEKYYNKILVLMFSLLFVLIFNCSLYAEDQTGRQDTETVKMEEMVVTSTRTEHSMLDTPSNISVITSKDIASMDAKTLPEVIKKLPGAFYSNASGLEPHLSLRGTRIGMSGGAMVILNGIPVSMGKFGYTDWESIPVENIERVEVVKGPLSSLYGGDSARGVINIVTKKSDKSVAGKVSFAAGDFHDRRYNALIYGSRDKFFYNLNAKTRRSRAYSNKSQVDNDYYNGEFGVYLADTVSLAFNFNVADKERTLARRLTEAEVKEDRNQATDYSYTENTDVITGLNLKVNQDIFDLTTTLYYKNRDKDYENYKMATKTPYKEELDEDVFGAKFIFTLKQPVAGKPNLLSAGFDYDNDQIDIENKKAASKTVGLPYTIADPKKSGDFKREEFGIFLQNEFSVIENLTLTAGIRYDYFEYDNDSDYDFSKGGALNYEDTPHYDKWNPRFAINYRPLNNFSIYGSYNKSYRAPNVYDYYYSASYSAKSAYTLKPEKFAQYEIGYRWFFTEWFNLDMSLFRIEIDDMLDTVYDQGGTYQGKQNISEVTIKGFEAAITGAPLKWLSYKLAYTYTDARYKSDTLVKDANKNVVSIRDNRLTKIPFNRVSADLDTTLFNINGYKLLWNVNMQYQDKYKMDKANDSEYKDYTLFNSKLNLSHKHFDIFVAAENLFDYQYDNYSYASYGKDYFYPAAGVTWFWGVAYKF